MAVNSNLTIQIKAIDQASQSFKSIQSGIIRLVGAAVALTAAFKAVTFPATVAAEFEREMINVAKTTNFTEGQMDRLSGTMLNLSKTMSLNATELASVAAVAGQLGLGQFGVEAIEKFTESVAKASITLGLSVELAAEFGAQLANIFNIDPTDMERVVSVLNELSNNSVATAGQLADIVKRIGNVGGVTLQQSAALAAFYRDMGVQVEVAGTTAVKQLSNMSAKAELFAKVAGISLQEWIELMEQDALVALTTVTTALSEMGRAQRDATAKELFGGGRILSVSTKLIEQAGNDYKKLFGFVDKANKAWITGTSSIDEYEKVMTSLSEQTKVMFNSLRAVSIEMGQKLTPAILDAVKAMQEFIASDAGRDFFFSIADGIGSMIDALKESISYLAEFGHQWTNILQVLKLVVLTLIGIKVASISLSILGPVILGLASAYRALGAGAAVATAATTKFSITSTILTATISRILGGLAALRVGIAGLIFSLGSKLPLVAGALALMITPIGAVITALVAAGAAIALFKDELLELFGFKTPEALKLALQIKVDERKAREDLSKALNTVAELSERVAKSSEVALDIPISTDTLEVKIEKIKKLFEGLKDAIDLEEATKKAAKGIEGQLDKLAETLGASLILKLPVPEGLIETGSELDKLKVKLEGIQKKLSEIRLPTSAGSSLTLAFDAVFNTEDLEGDAKALGDLLGKLIVEKAEKSGGEFAQKYLNGLLKKFNKLSAKKLELEVSLSEASGDEAEKIREQITALNEEMEIYSTIEFKGLVQQLTFLSNAYKSLENQTKQNTVANKEYLRITKELENQGSTELVTRAVDVLIPIKKLKKEYADLTKQLSKAEENTLTYLNLERELKQKSLDIAAKQLKLTELLEEATYAPLTNIIEFFDNLDEGHLKAVKSQLELDKVAKSSTVGQTAADRTLLQVKQEITGSLVSLTRKYVQINAKIALFNKQTADAVNVAKRVQGEWDNIQKTIRAADKRLTDYVAKMRASFTDRDADAATKVFESGVDAQEVEDIEEANKAYAERAKWFDTLNKSQKEYQRIVRGVTEDSLKKENDETIKAIEARSDLTKSTREAATAEQKFAEGLEKVKAALAAMKKGTEDLDKLTSKDTYKGTAEEVNNINKNLLGLEETTQVGAEAIGFLEDALEGLRGTDTEIVDTEDLNALLNLLQKVTAEYNNLKTEATAARTQAQGVNQGIVTEVNKTLGAELSDVNSKTNEIVKGNTKLVQLVKDLKIPYVEVLKTAINLSKATSALTTQLGKLSKGEFIETPEIKKAQKVLEDFVNTVPTGEDSKIKLEADLDKETSKKNIKQSLDIAINETKGSYVKLESEADKDKAKEAGKEIADIAQKTADTQPVVAAVVEPSKQKPQIVQPIADTAVLNKQIDDAIAKLQSKQKFKIDAEAEVSKVVITKDGENSFRDAIPKEMTVDKFIVAAGAEDDVQKALDKRNLEASAAIKYDEAQAKTEVTKVVEYTTKVIEGKTFKVYLDAEGATVYELLDDISKKEVTTQVTPVLNKEALEDVEKGITKAPIQKEVELKPVEQPEQATTELPPLTQKVQPDQESIDDTKTTVAEEFSNIEAFVPIKSVNTEEISSKTVSDQLPKAEAAVDTVIVDPNVHVDTLGVELVADKVTVPDDLEVPNLPVTLEAAELIGAEALRAEVDVTLNVSKKTKEDADRVISESFEGNTADVALDVQTDPLADIDNEPLVVDVETKINETQIRGTAQRVSDIFDEETGNKSVDVDLSVNSRKVNTTLTEAIENKEVIINTSTDPTNLQETEQQIKDGINVPPEDITVNLAINKAEAAAEAAEAAQTISDSLQSEEYLIPITADTSKIQDQIDQNISGGVGGAAETKINISTEVDTVKANLDKDTLTKVFNDPPITAFINTEVVNPDPAILDTADISVSMSATLDENSIKAEADKISGIVESELDSSLYDVNISVDETDARQALEGIGGDTSLTVKTEADIQSIANTNSEILNGLEIPTQDVVISPKIDPVSTDIQLDELTQKVSTEFEAKTYTAPVDADTTDIPKQIADSITSAQIADPSVSIKASVDAESVSSATLQIQNSVQAADLSTDLQIDVDNAAIALQANEASDAFKVNFEGTKYKANIDTDTTSIKADIVQSFGEGLTVPLIPSDQALQEALLSETYEINLHVNKLTGLNTDAQANAAGGPIAGPGTGTSDSILSWLSNGEYVIKAASVAKFGTGFFDALNSGMLPKFASGGLASVVPQAQPAAAASTGSRDVIDLNLNFADNHFEVSGERDQIKGLVQALKYVQGG